ncbi:YdiU family protein [Methyloversatilis sp. XJ19-13]|uniref:protein adenylyltransferase SelO n=1 Tax=Methyloversatilis sp. XJ19-13 TaxID=2963430 RepID=UPI00211C2277|nr:YdiU family protein [Methyloversatilis sp. XJ19-13]MCQ9373501.1 YdiU family protein [Methyloversatilis sp. XJ19-13]
MSIAARRLDEIEFDNVFVRSLPADPSADMRSRPVIDASYTLTSPTPVAAPELLAWSDVLGAQLGLRRPARVDVAVEALAGNRILPGMQPYAARYGGHQFGNWAGQLGDGRAITLGEMIDTAGQRQELQLKGAGPTPYSRRADGRAVLRSSVREFLCSEAMFHLGIPTTRALSLVATGDRVVRDMFYDGHPEYEPGAIVCRVAPSFVRFGHFEILASHEELDLQRRLADWVMTHHFPGITSPADWFAEICRRTAVLMVEWMRVGFVHGVMNTDNMSILGLTIDYGPYGWLEGVDMMWTPNTTDAQGRRYCYGRQPQIGYWNLTRLAAALSPLIDDQAAIDAALEGYEQTFSDRWTRMLADKLGLPAAADEAEQAMRSELFQLLQAEECDFTIFFRALAEVPVATALAGDAAALAPLHDAFYSADGPSADHGRALLAWLQGWAQRVTAGGEADAARVARMNASNPKYIVRNWLAQRAIDDAGAGDTAMIERLLKMMQQPYDEQPEFNDLAGRRPEWARNKPGCSALSCSS